MNLLANNNRTGSNRSPEQTSNKNNEYEFPHIISSNILSQQRNEMDLTSHKGIRGKSRGGFSSQFKALLYKNITLQKRQVGTNIFQMVTPLITLFATLFIKGIMSGKVGDYTFQLNMPYIYNVPYHKVYTNENSMFNNTSDLIFGSCLQLYLYDFEHASDATIKFIGDNTTGMLSKILPEISSVQEYYQCKNHGTMPSFDKPVNGSIDNQIYENLRYINNIDYHTVPEVYIIPDGAVTFYEASPSNLTIKIQINDLVPAEYHRSNGVTKYYVNASGSADADDDNNYLIRNVYDGQLILLDAITKSYIRSFNADGIPVSGSLPMPDTSTTQNFVQKIITLSTATLFPIALSLLLPVFMYSIVLEKEERLREIMKMNGMKISNYWIANYVWSMILYIASILIFILFGRYIIIVDFFTETNIWVIFVVFLGWGLSQVSISVFFQNFFKRSKTALISGYLLAVWTTIIAVSFSIGVFADPKKLPIGFKFYPTFAFVRLMNYLTDRCGNFSCLRYFSQFNDEMWECLALLYIDAIIYLIIGLYLDQVLPQEHGIAKHPLFFIRKSRDKTNTTKNKQKTPLLDNNSIVESYRNKVNENKIEVKAENAQSHCGDEHVQRERDYVNDPQLNPNSHPLLIRNLKKVYKTVSGKPPKVAVDNFSLHIKKGEMFGLLGPNGAGKTSLIAMLTGLYPPEAGDAWVGGYNIKDQIDFVHSQMGVCPQFDLLWPDLTVEEHLLFYVRIRGVSKKDEKTFVKRALDEVGLANFSHLKIKQLSGGMKRRLSVAISLVGDPQIVFLDEPTTGLDPENRRQLWDILTDARHGRAIVLTTHSMEEADVLCNRIGIMTDGILRCLGSQARLKSRYGGGYHLFINCYKYGHLGRHHSLDDAEDINDNNVKVQKYISRILPHAELKSFFNGSFIYLVPYEGLEVSKIFEHLELKKVELAISDWGISQSTLEDVFMEIVENT